MSDRDSPTCYRGRLAPSPTGALHLGNARTFLAVWLRARQRGGKVLLRVEDIDGPRVKSGAAEEAMADLRWLGLDWDEGPDLGGPVGPYVQSARLDRYAAAVEALLARGLAYPCVCSRREVDEAASAPHAVEQRRDEKAGTDAGHVTDGPVYPGTCRGRFPSRQAALRETGRPAAVRFRVDASHPPIASAIAFDDLFAGAQRFAPAALGDFVIEKADGGAAYQLACVLDDAAMGVTEVVRADDLLPSAARQHLLYEALGLTPPAFVHLPLVVGPDGRRLAKRHGDTRVRAVRDAGARPERLVGLLARWLGIDLAAGQREVAARDLIDRFALARIPRGPLVCEPADVARDLGVRESALVGARPQRPKRVEAP